MLPFYGRKLSRKNKNFCPRTLKANEFFFDESNSRLSKEFNNSKSVFNLEIGFGKGDNLIYQSQIKKNEIFFAIDPYLSGGLNLLKSIKINKISNVFFSDLPFIKFVNLAKNISFKKVYILFPDPWPKKKHKKRRLINEKFVQSLNKITSSKSQIIIATDDSDYSNQISRTFSNMKNFKLFLKRNDNLSFQDNDIYPTKYFTKARNQNRKINFFIFTKL